MSNKHLKEDIAGALANDNLRGALGRFADAYVGARAKAYENKDFQSLREQISQLKRSAARQMEKLADEFTRNAAKRGVKVFRATTAEEAKDYIRQLALERGIKHVVKSKSMASEEIHLNAYLKEKDLDVVETDLGEWIIQLCGQRPSHMVMPAIHMTRGQVADVFSKEMKKNLEPDIPQLVKVARRELREKFLQAEMGISGANIAVAETGTLVMCTNEGNGRLVSSLPPVHVFVVGLEKLVAKFKDVGPILEALPRSATAQQITSYVTMISGPTQAVGPDGSCCEQKEMHVILLDNGRSKMKNDPVFQEAMQCIRCASCLNVCPVFQLVGGHVYGHIYTGGIGTILTAFLNDFGKAGEIQNLCLRCERCKDFCPGQINLPKLIAELRSRVVKEQGLPGSQKLIIEKVLTNRKLFHTLLRTASLAQKPFVKGQMIRHLPLFFAGLTEGRSLPAITGTPFRDKFPQLPKAAKPQARVGFFGGCLIDFVYPEIGESVHKVLNKLNMKMVFPMEQSCCGYPAQQMGAPEAAVKLAKINIEAFEQANVDYIITACPTCTEALLHTYTEVLAAEPDWVARAGQMAAKIHDFSSFVHEHTNGGADLGLASLTGQVTYHDSCHLKRKLGVFEQPRQLITRAGLNLVEMKGSDLCCGFGGSYSIKFPELSIPILGQKIGSIVNTGVKTVALDCPGCRMQISGGLDRTNQSIQVKHTAQILAEAIDLAAEKKC